MTHPNDSRSSRETTNSPKPSTPNRYDDDPLASSMANVNEQSACLLKRSPANRTASSCSGRSNPLTPRPVIAPGPRFPSPADCSRVALHNEQQPPNVAIISLPTHGQAFPPHREQFAGSRLGRRSSRPGSSRSQENGSVSRRSSTSDVASGSCCPASSPYEHPASSRTPTTPTTAHLLMGAVPGTQPRLR